MCKMVAPFLKHFNVINAEQRPDKRSVEDLKELRYLECVIKVLLVF